MRRPARRRAGHGTAAESPYAGAGAGEELFGALSSREIAGRAGVTFALALSTVVFQLGCAAFALLYALDLGLVMVLVGTAQFTRFWRAKGDARASDAVAGVFFLTLLWLVLVFLPVVAAWAGVAAAAEPRRLSTSLVAVARSLDLRVAALALLLVALRVRQARHESRQPEQPGPTLFRPVLRRALCVAAFVFFGPMVFFGLRELGLAEPVAMAATYALSETYPFVATLIDRLLHRVWR